MAISVFEIVASGGDKVVKMLTQTNKGLEQTRKATSAIAKQGGVARAVAGSDKDAKINQKVMDQLQKSLEEKQKIIDLIQQKMQTTGNLDSWNRLRSKLGEYSDDVDDLIRMQEDLLGLMKKTSEADFPDFDMGGGGFGRNPLSPLGTASNTLSSFGGFDSPVSGIADALDGITQLVDNAQMMSMEFQEAGESITGMVKSLKDIRQSGGGAGDAIKGLAGGLSTAGGLSLLLTANIAAWGAVFNKVNEKSQEAKDAVFAYINAKERERNVNREIADLLQSGDVDSAAARLDEAWQTQREATDRAADINTELARLEQDWVDLGSSLNIVARNNIRDTKAALEEELAGIFSPGGDLEQALEVISKYSDALPQIEEQRRKIEANERYKQAEIDLIEVRQQAEESTKAYAQSLQDFQDQLAFDRGRELEDRQISDRRQAADHAEGMLQIETDNDERIEELRASHLDSLSELEASYNKEEIASQIQLAKSIQSIYTDLDKSVAATRKEFQETRQREEDRFRKEEEKSRKAYEKERLRRVQDLNDDLLSAEEANDVAAFIAAQRAGKKDLARMDEDFRDREKESRDAFEEERKLAEDEQAQRIAQMRTDAEERRQELLAQAEEDRQARATAFAEQLDAQHTAYQDQLASQKAQYDKQYAAAVAANEKQQALEQEDRELADRRREEDNQRQLDQMEKQFNNEIDALQKKESDLMVIYRSKGTEQVQAVTLAQLQIVEEYRRGGALAAAAVRSAFAASAYSAGTASLPTGTSGSNSSISRNGTRVVAADKGTYTSTPKLTLLGERRPEVVLPLDRSNGIPPDILRQMGGGSGPSFDFSGMTISGAGVTPEFMRTELEKFGQTVTEVIYAARSGTYGRAG